MLCKNWKIELAIEAVELAEGKWQKLFLQRELSGWQTVCKWRFSRADHRPLSFRIFGKDFGYKVTITTEEDWNILQKRLHGLAEENRNAIIHRIVESRDSPCWKEPWKIICSSLLGTREPRWDYLASCHDAKCTVTNLKNNSQEFLSRGGDSWVGNANGMNEEKHVSNRCWGASAGGQKGRQTGTQVHSDGVISLFVFLKREIPT